jgi:hypothetical protein
MYRAQQLIPLLVIGACAGDTDKSVVYPDGGGATNHHDTSYTPPPPPPPGQEAGVTPTPAYDTGLSTGSASCTDIFACFYTSQCQDQTCYQTCVAKGSATAQQQYQAVEQCEQSAACSTCNAQQLDMTCATCLDQSCKQQYTACGMTQTCQQGYNCLQSCGQNDLQCFEACLSKLSAIGMGQYMASETCWDSAVKGVCAASCSDQQSQQCYTCVDGKCAAEFKACGLI